MNERMDFSQLQLLLAKKKSRQHHQHSPGQVRQFYRLDAPAPPLPYRSSIEREVSQPLPPPPNIFASPPAPSPSPISDRSFTLSNSFHSAVAPGSGHHLHHRHFYHEQPQACSVIDSRQYRSHLRDTLDPRISGQYRHSSSSIDHKTLSLTSFERSHRRNDQVKINKQKQQLVNGLHQVNSSTNNRRSNSFQQTKPTTNSDSLEFATKRLSVGQCLPIFQLR